MAPEAPSSARRSQVAKAKVVGFLDKFDGIFRAFVSDNDFRCTKLSCVVSLQINTMSVIVVSRSPRFQQLSIVVVTPLSARGSLRPMLRPRRLCCVVSW